MAVKKNRMTDDKRTLRNTIVAFALIVAVMGILCFQYYLRLQSTVKTESAGYLQEISKQMSTNVSKTVNDNFSVLGTISTVLKNTNVTSFDQILPVVQEQQNYWNYQSVMLLDESGTAYDANGKKVLINSEEQYLRDVIVQRKRSMSPSQTVNGSESVLFAIPVDNLVVGGIKMSALAATYDLRTFDQILSMSAFSGKAYAHIVQKDGTVVVRSSSQFAEKSGYNIVSSLSSAKMCDNSSYDKMKTDIASGQSGQIEYSMGERHEYMVYQPLDTENWCLLTFVPVAAVNAKSELLLKITLLLCGVITLVFAALLTVLMITFVRNKRHLEQIAYVDPITGGNTIQRFYEEAGELLLASGSKQYALVYTNIEKFKVLNEQFGRTACDDILKGIEKGIASCLRDKESMGRLFADNFCILMEYVDEDDMAARFEEWYSAFTREMKSFSNIQFPLIIDFGTFVIGNRSMPFPHMIDRAKLSLREMTREIRGKLRYSVYDEEVRKRLFREKQLEDMMEESLANNEFRVFLQPKYRASTEQIDGAEALVRWVSKTEGMIYPDEFISLFEKNGFIVQLDLWVFEQVCHTIRAWIDAGKKPIKVSVNCSRVHLKNRDFLDNYHRICDQCGIPPEYIEIELTENVVFQDVERLTQVIEEIHAAGFGCSMDDFGSGYSSLNLIQDIPVDTLKLDKIFFRNGAKDINRMKSVVGSILVMARALSMYTVAEGVEEREQVDMLRELGCDFIQGYYYAKPMPIQDFEKLAFGGPVLEKKEDAPA